MLVKLSIVALAASSALAASIEPRSPSSVCSPERLSCCNEVVTPADGAKYDQAMKAATGGIVGLLQGLLGGLLGRRSASNSGPIGLVCNQGSLLGAGSAVQCKSEAVCCDKFNAAGSIGFNCNSIDKLTLISLGQ